MGELAVIEPRPLSDVRKGPGWRRTILRHLRRHGFVSRAADAAGVSVAMAYKARKRSARFAEAWRWAAWEGKLRIREDLEAAAVERALNGWREPVHHRGQVVGYRTRFSERLLIFLLEALHPKYRRDGRGYDEWEPEPVPEPPPALASSPEYLRLRAELDAAMEAAKAKGLPGPVGGCGTGDGTGPG